MLICGRWKRPTAEPTAESAELTVFKGRLRFSCELTAKDLIAPGEVVCTVRYQVCNSDRCLPVKVIQLTEKLVP